MKRLWLTTQDSRSLPSQWRGGKYSLNHSLLEATGWIMEWPLLPRHSTRAETVPKQGGCNGEERHYCSSLVVSHGKCSTLLQVSLLRRCDTLQNVCLGRADVLLCLSSSLGRIPPLSLWFLSLVLPSAAVSECCQSDFSLMPTGLNSSLWTHGTRLSLTCTYPSSQLPLPSFPTCFQLT